MHCIGSLSCLSSAELGCTSHRYNTGSSRFIDCAVIKALSFTHSLDCTSQASDGGNAEELPDLSQEQQRILDLVM